MKILNTLNTKLKTKIFIILYFLYCKYLLQIISKAMVNIAYSIKHLILFIFIDEFKNKKTYECMDISNQLKNELLELTPKQSNNIEFDTIRERAIDDTEILNLISKYFILCEYKERKIFNKENDYFEKAKQYDKNIQKINSDKEVLLILKEVTKKRKKNR